MADRISSINRDTNETKIKVNINLDGTGKSSFNTGVPFLEHMLDQISRHGLIDMDIEAVGDLQIDAHHTVEDIGISLGMAINKAIGDKKGITRYGHAYVPLDESLSRTVIDFSGRPELVDTVNYPKSNLGDFDTELFHEFFQGFVNHAMVTLHIDTIRGSNTHHIAETVFKSFGRALRMAIEMDPRMQGVVPSTKGSL
jgi:imidazoleglycerol-phosphate dehydratase